MLDADLASDCRVRAFELAYPERFVENGIAEQDMVSMAAGLARHGLLPVVNSFAELPRVARERADLQPGERADEGRLRAPLRRADPRRPGQVPPEPARRLAPRRDPGHDRRPARERRGDARRSSRWAVEEATESVAIRLAIGPSPRRIELPDGVRREPGCGTVLREGDDAMLVAYGPVMLHEALTRGGAARGARASASLSSRCRGSTASTAEWLAERSRRTRTLFVVEDHSPVGGLGDALRARCLRHAASLVASRCRGLARLRDAARGAARHGLDGASLAERVAARVRARWPDASGGPSGSGSFSPTRSRRGSSSMRASSRGCAAALDERLTARLPRAAGRGGSAWAARLPPDAIAASRRRSSCRGGGAAASESCGGPTAGSTGGSGYYPLAIRLNLRHGFHRERMAARPPQLDARLGSRRPAPALGHASSAAWLAGTSRRAATCRSALCRAHAGGSAPALVLSNVQLQSAVPFLVAARRLGLPSRRLRRELGPHGRQGRDLAALDRYVVQNEVMREDLVRYHGIAPERIVVTGWPQTDVFHRQRPRAEYEALLRGYGLDPARPLVLVMGNTPTNTPYEDRFVERLVEWWAGGAAERLSLLFRPHPRDREWRERFAAARARRSGVHVQEPSYTDIEVLATLLQHADCVVANAGTILLDALVNDRPAVCVLYDEGAPPRGVVGGEERDRRALRGARRAPAPSTAPRPSTRSWPGSSARSRIPTSSRAERRRVAEQVVGEVDGRAAERVVDAIVDAVDPERCHPHASDWRTVVLRLGVVICVAVAAMTAAGRLDDTIAVFDFGPT